MQNPNSINSGLFDSPRERVLMKMADELETLLSYPNLPITIQEWVKAQEEALFDNNFIKWDTLTPLLNDEKLLNFLLEQCETFRETIQLTLS